MHFEHNKVNAFLISFFCSFNLPPIYSSSKLCTPITSPYRITIRNSFSVPAVGAGNDLSRMCVILVHEGTTKLFSFF